MHGLSDNNVFLKGGGKGGFFFWPEGKGHVQSVEEGPCHHDGGVELIRREKKHREKTRLSPSYFGFFEKAARW